MRPSPTWQPPASVHAAAQAGSVRLLVRGSSDGGSLKGNAAGNASGNTRQPAGCGGAAAEARAASAKCNATEGSSTSIGFCMGTSEVAWCGRASGSVPALLEDLNLNPGHNNKWICGSEF